jgi:hypothetical protein
VKAPRTRRQGQAPGGTALGDPPGRGNVGTIPGAMRPTAVRLAADCIDRLVDHAPRPRASSPGLSGLARSLRTYRVVRGPAAWEVSRVSVLARSWCVLAGKLHWKGAPICS